MSINKRGYIYVNENRSWYKRQNFNNMQYQGVFKLNLKCIIFYKQEKNVSLSINISWLHEMNEVGRINLQRLINEHNNFVLFLFKLYQIAFTRILFRMSQELTLLSWLASRPLARVPKPSEQFYRNELGRLYREERSGDNYSVTMPTEYSTQISRMDEILSSVSKMPWLCSYLKQTEKLITINKSISNENEKNIDRDIY